MSKEIVHYSIDEIDKKGALFNIIWGERSNGKSYQVKHKKGVESYLFGQNTYLSSFTDKEKIFNHVVKSGSRFILMRRWKEEITTEKIEKYFADVDVLKLTDGKYNCITMYRKTLYLSNYNYESGKTTRHEVIGYVVALSTEQNYAGSSYLDVSDIIFEEFMSRSVYLADESSKLLNFWSTVDRQRGTTRVWLVGNTISRVCPYLTDWNLQSIISRQKQGEIICKWMDTGDIDKETNKPIQVKLAIEYCKSNNHTSYAFGTHKDMINKGDWQSDPQPHLPKSKKCYKILYRIVFQYQSFKFIGEYLKDNETHDTIWFVYPYNGQIKDNILVISDVIKTSPYWQRDIYNLSVNNDKLKKLCQTFRENKIFYSSDLCGTDFKQVIDFEIRR
jgi:hypothetical protein